MNNFEITIYHLIIITNYFNQLHSVNKQHVTQKQTKKVFGK